MNKKENTIYHKLIIEERHHRKNCYKIYSICGQYQTLVRTVSFSSCQVSINGETFHVLFDTDMKINKDVSSMST